MRTSRALLAGSVLLAATAATCTGVSHLHLFQPPSPSAVSHQAGSPTAVRVPAPDPQLGIDIDFYYWPGMNVPATAKDDIAYIKRLHANAVSISFPFFMTGRGSSAVYAASATPSPAVLSTVVLEAERAGLYVWIRPLLDEHNLGGSRVQWKPADPAAWFASYQAFLLPYAEMAQADHVPVMVTGVEFSKFSRSPYWARMDTALRQVYDGTLSYANNWGERLSRAVDAEGVVQTVDAYHPLPLPADATLGQVQGAWDAYGRTLPHGVLLTELGIAAQAGAYAAPYRTDWQGRRLVTAIQERWFTAACHAVVNDHLGGIYFWSIGFAQPLNAPPTASDPAAFAGGPGADAISACFENLNRTPR